jgi:hypothetical protein
MCFEPYRPFLLDLDLITLITSDFRSYPALSLNRTLCEKDFGQPWRKRSEGAEGRQRRMGRCLWLGIKIFRRQLLAFPH